MVSQNRDVLSWVSEPGLFSWPFHPHSPRDPREVVPLSRLVVCNTQGSATLNVVLTEYAGLLLGTLLEAGGREEGR